MVMLLTHRSMSACFSEKTECREGKRQVTRACVYTRLITHYLCKVTTTKAAASSCCVPTLTGHVDHERAVKAIQSRALTRSASQHCSKAAAVVWLPHSPDPAAPLCSAPLPPHRHSDSIKHTLPPHPELRGS